MKIEPIRLYTLKEVGSMLHVGHRDVQRLLASGELPEVRIRPTSHPRVAGQSILNYIHRKSFHGEEKM